MFETGDKRKDIVLGYGFKDQKFTAFPKPGYPWFGSKFWDLNARGQASGKDLYVLRYADVLLMLSEAENELGNISGSVRWMNMIRERAGLPALATSTTKAEITEKIFSERAIEFVGEFQRRFDLNRWGKLVEAAKSVAVDNPIGAAKVRPYHQYYPISQDEIIKNPNLKQNEGY
ncbi:RagB/SusD family nutrient uptake outer membrane protein [Sphingobacterium daejeonense]|uniref:RagB/SusD family nutrient uptake outer membrane protein n=1 Tax=Sphingobacterium daejeonense TaxID=371142 RepID=UPI0014853C13|nr:RagB/SusD family nutrient uptake outer membrane protein [Sphingobacterium daejeonense]